MLFCARTPLVKGDGLMISGNSHQSARKVQFFFFPKRVRNLQCKFLFDWCFSIFSIYQRNCYCLGICWISNSKSRWCWANKKAISGHRSSQWFRKGIPLQNPPLTQVYTPKVSHRTWKWWFPTPGSPGIQGVIFRFHVKLQGCRNYTNLPRWSQPVEYYWESVPPTSNLHNPDLPVRSYFANLFLFMVEKTRPGPLSFCV